MYRNWIALYIVVFAVQAGIQIHNPRDGAPLILDHAEVHNIAWNLVQGRGYSYDWDDARWRALYLAHSRPSGMLSMIMCRSGSHVTMSRPPLMPLLVAVAIKLYPAHQFLMWRLMDAAFFSLAVCFLTTAAKLAFGNAAAVVVFVLTLIDPLRMTYVPGWWTEGLAFDCIAVLVWLIARARPGMRTIVSGGITLGLLCLDRSFFVLILPVLAWVVGIAAVDQKAPIQRRILAVMMTLAIAVVVQLPWWVRNVELSHRLLPLGTQGGFNLPDEYSDHAVAIDGNWDGDGMGWVWSTRPGATADEIAGRFAPNVAGMRPAHPRAGDALFATMCLTLESEIEVCDAGQHAAVAWIKMHPAQLPRLFVMKVITQVKYDKWWIGLLAVVGAIGFFVGKRRQLQIGLAVVIAIYMVGCGLTHVMPGRFLLPILPPLYLLVGALVSRAARAADPVETEIDRSLPLP